MMCSGPSPTWPHHAGLNRQAGLETRCPTRPLSTADGVNEQSRCSSSLSDPRLMDSSPEMKASPAMSQCSAIRQASGSSWSVSGAIASSWSPQLTPIRMVFPSRLSTNSCDGGLVTPIMGSAVDRLAWRVSLHRQVLMDRRAQCSQEAGAASVAAACCSPRHVAQTEWVSATDILLPYTQILAGSLKSSMVRKGTNSDILLAPKRVEAATFCGQSSC